MIIKYKKNHNKNKVITKYLASFFIFLFFSTNAYSHAKKGIHFFTSRDFNKPFISEISSTLNKICFGNVKSTKISGEGVKTFSINEIHLGIDVPLIFSNKSKLKWAISMPVSSHMTWYPLEEETSPILNNDYRFGFSFTGHLAIQNRYIKNLSFLIKPFAHESSHLGDEFTIMGFQEDSSFYRVNITYEYYELSLTLNDPEMLDENVLSMRLGFMGLINPKNGYYTLFKNEIGNNTLYPSNHSGEFYVDFNYKKVNGLFTSKLWKPNISVELRNRIKYDYRNTDNEERIWCTNIFAGYDYIPEFANTVKSIGHYIRYYNGVAPYGQFRIGTCYFIGYSMVINI